MARRAVGRRIERVVTARDRDRFMGIRRAIVKGDRWLGGTVRCLRSEGPEPRGGRRGVRGRYRWGRLRTLNPISESLERVIHTGSKELLEPTGRGPEGHDFPLAGARSEPGPGVDPRPSHRPDGARSETDQCLRKAGIEGITGLGRPPGRALHLRLGNPSAAPNMQHPMRCGILSGRPDSSGSRCGPIRSRTGPVSALAPENEYRLSTN